uniref:Uncharacterized protein n=1 Tax=Pararge aegeria TaxID=116150 RepID=S4P0Q4_9NEOP
MMASLSLTRACDAQTIECRFPPSILDNIAFFVLGALKTLATLRILHSSYSKIPRSFGIHPGARNVGNCFTPLVEQSSIKPYYSDM